MTEKEKINCPVTGCDFVAEVDWTNRGTAVIGVFTLVAHMRGHDRLDRKSVV